MKNFESIAAKNSSNVLTLIESLYNQNKIAELTRLKKYLDYEHFKINELLVRKINNLTER